MGDDDLVVGVNVNFWWRVLLLAVGDNLEKSGLAICWNEGYNQRKLDEDFTQRQ